MTVLVDYFGREITDSLTVARRFAGLAADGNLSVRLDTPGSRFVEGLDPTLSYAVLERHVPARAPRLSQRAGAPPPGLRRRHRRRDSGTCATRSTAKASSA